MVKSHSKPSDDCVGPQTGGGIWLQNVGWFVMGKVGGSKGLHSFIPLKTHHTPVQYKGGY